MRVLRHNLDSAAGLAGTLTVHARHGLIAGQIPRYAP